MAAELAKAAPEPENDINEETEVELSSHGNQAVVMFSFDAFAHALSGATGSVLAMSAFYPLDTIRTRLQVEEKSEAKSTFSIIQEICKEEGITPLYRGLLPVLSSLYCSNFVYFYTFHGLKKLVNSGGASHRPSVDLLLGYFSGIVNSLLTTPLWVANTRLKLRGVKRKNEEQNDRKKTQYNGLLGTVYCIAKEEGILALWRGVQTSFLLSANPAIQFMVYEAIKRFALIFKKDNTGKIKEIKSIEYFIMGGAAKAVATILTYPLQLAQCRLRASQDKLIKSSNGVFHMLMKIFKEKGIIGLYKGLEAKLMQTVLTAALMFLVYEKLMKLIMTILKVRN